MDGTQIALRENRSPFAARRPILRRVGNAIVMVVDLASSVALMEAAEIRTIAAWLRLRARVLDDCVARFGGSLVKSTGDGVLALFDDAASAFDCAICIQRRASAPSVTRNGLRLRIGLHAGRVVRGPDDVYGDCVNVAFRLQEHAPSGGIIASRPVHDALGTARFSAVGAPKLRSLVRSVEAFVFLPA